nr:hypothetical protein PanWU01x14_163860 [Ipomoea trifida]
MRTNLDVALISYKLQFQDDRRLRLHNRTRKFGKKSVGYQLSIRDFMLINLPRAIGDIYLAVITLFSGFFFSVSFAIRLAALRECWFLRRESIITLNLLLSAGYCFTHSKSFCSEEGRFLSIARLPVRISYRTTPKLHTSVFTDKCPVSMYSGAVYPIVPIG